MRKRMNNLPQLRLWATDAPRPRRRASESWTARGSYAEAFLSGVFAAFLLVAIFILLITE